MKRENHWLKRMKKQREDLSFLLPIREFADRGTKWLLEFDENVEGLLGCVYIV